MTKLEAVLPWFARQEIAVTAADLQELTLRPRLVINAEELDQVSRGTVLQESAA
jgi:hypothetical protein